MRTSSRSSVLGQRRLRLLLGCTVVFALTLVLAQLASAAFGPIGRFDLGLDAQPADVAVNGSGAGGASPGDVYLTGAVQFSKPLVPISQFSASSELVRTWGRDVVKSGPGEADEVQAIRVDATAGAFRLAFGGDATADIPASASAGQVETALNGLGSIAGEGSVSVSGGPGDAGGTSPYLVEFDGGSLAGTDRPGLVASDGTPPLSGGVSAYTINEGATGFEVCDPSAGDECGLPSASFEPLTELRYVAVNQATGSVYATGSNRVNEFSATGDFIRAFGRDVVSAGPDDSSIDEQQSVSVGANSTGGVFTLSLSVTGVGSEFETTGPIPYNASPAALESILNGLAEVGGNYSSVTVTNSGNPNQPNPPGEPYVVTFHGILGGDDLPQIEASATRLIASGPKSVTASTLTDGGAPEVCGVDDGCKRGVDSPLSGSIGFFADPAIAPAGAPNEGNLLVAGGSSRVAEFTATGEFVRFFGYDVDQTNPSTGFEVCTAASGDVCKNGVLGTGIGQFSGISSLAVDSTGAIYTVESAGAGGLRAQKFTPAGGLDLTPSLFGSDESQAVTVNAADGQFRLAFGSVREATQGTGDVTAGSRIMTNVVITKGALGIGQPIGGTSVIFRTQSYIVDFDENAHTITLNAPPFDGQSDFHFQTDLPYTTGSTGTGDVAAGSTTITNVLVSSATATGKFLVGQEITGPGIPAGTLVNAAGPGTITLSQPATANGTAVPLAADLPYDAPANVVENALNSLGSIDAGGGSVSVSGGPGDATGSTPYAIDFDGGRLQRTDPPPLAASNGATPLSAGSGPGASTASVTTTTPGGPRGTVDAEAPENVAIAPGDEVYFLKNFPVGQDRCPDGIPSPPEVRIQRLTSSGSVIETSKPCLRLPVFSSSGTSRLGFGVDQTTGHAYVSLPGFESSALVFGTPTPPPSVVLNPVSGIEANGGTISGSINPNGPTLGYPSSSGNPKASATTYRIEFKKASEATWTKYTPDIPLGNGTSSLPFSVGVTGLAANTPYDLKVVVTKPFISIVEETKSFTTAPAAPRIESVFSKEVTVDSALLQAKVNPQGTDTTYHFEYGTTPAYGQNTPETDIGDSLQGQDVSDRVEGLQDAVYHFRVVATNPHGTTRSDDQTLSFHPPVCPNQTVRQQTGAAYLPDCRAYELVSPEDAGGTTLTTGGPQSPYASNPPRLAFVGTLAGIPGSGRTPINTTGDLYVATRGAEGWRTRYVGPSAEEAGCVGGRPLVAGTGSETTIQNDVMADPGLNRIIDWNLGNPMECISGDLGGLRFSDFNTAARGSNAPYVWNANGDFLDRWPTQVGDVAGSKENFDCPQDPSLHPYPPGVNANIPVSYFCSTYVSASKDLNHFVFSTRSGLFGEGGITTAPGSAYDNDIESNTLKLISKLPGGGPIGQEPDGKAGPEELIQFPSVSADGSHILMGTSVKPVCKQLDYPASDQDTNHPYCPLISQPTHLYMRVGNAVTYDVSAGKPVHYIGTTPDGTKAYFTSDEQLTGDDDDESVDLFMWSENGGTPQLTRVSKGGSGSAGNTDNCASTWTEDCDVETYVDSRISSADGNQGGLGTWTEQSTNPGYTDNAIAAGSGDIYFYSPEQLVPGKGAPGKENLYVYREGGVQLAAALEDDPYCIEERTSETHDETCSDGAVGRIQVTPNGRFAAFVTTSRLTAYDNHGFAEMYRYDAQEEAIQCVSCRQDGEAPTADVLASQGGRFITDDGRVFFNTAEALVPQDTNTGLDDNGQIAGTDVYEFVEGRPQLITTGTGTGARGSNSESQAGLYGVSADGVDVYFGTYETLVGQDRNGAQLKFYDARTNGGFSFVPPPQPCAAADECHGPTAAVPAPLANGTGTSLSGGNATEAGKKPRKQGRKHRKQKKRAQHKKSKASAKAKRAAQHQEGGSR